MDNMDNFIISPSVENMWKNITIFIIGLSIVIR